MKRAQHGLSTVVLAALLVAGCRSDAESKANPASTTSEEAGRIVTTSAPASISSAPAAGTAQNPSNVRALKLFQTPSRNIACNLIEGESVECEFGEHSFSPPPKPASCEFDWGQSLAVDSKGAEFTCVSDTFREGSLPVLAYGETSRIGNVECASKEDGLTCTHVPSRHGFFVSRTRYDLF